MDKGYFECENCGAPTKKLIIPKDSDGLGKLRCPLCYESTSLRPTYFHQRWEGATRNDKGLTYAKADIIANRRISREDGLTVIDKRTGKETQY